MSPPPELQGSQGTQRKGRKEGTDEEMSRPPELHGNRQERERLEKRSTPSSAFASGDETSRATPSSSFVSGEATSSPPELQGNLQERERLEKRATPSSAFSYGEEMFSPPELEGTRRQEREGRELRATEDASSDTSSDEEMRPGAVAVPGLFTGRTSPSVLSESQVSSAIDDEQSTIMGELAEPSQEDEELRRRYTELQRIVSEAGIGTVIVENSGAGNHDQDAAPSPFGRKERIWLIGAAFALLLVVGVILGVTFSLTTNNDNGSLSNDSVVTPAQSPAPTEAPTACNSLDCLTKLLLQNEVSDAEALQDDSSPQFLALRWLANNDPAVLDLNSTPTVILVERYVLAMLYFATSAEDRLNGLKSVCEWRGVVCNGDDLVVALLLGKSKPGEVIVLISKFRIDSPVYFLFSFSGGGV
jgi:hypothetical protein